MANFDFTNEYFLDVSRKCRYNESMARFYERMADMEYDKLYPLYERDYDRWYIHQTTDYKKMYTYLNRAKSVRVCMRYGWTSDFYRMNGVKVVRGVNRCRDRFCYNCQSMDALQRFHQYSPIIDRFSGEYDVYHVVFSQPNVPGFLLGHTLDLMQASFSRWVGFMSGKKKIRGLDLVGQYGFVGAVRALEVSQNDNDKNYHPHYHCMVVLKKGIDITPKHRTMFSKDRTHRREDRLFSDFEVFLQRIWYLLMNGIRVTKKNLDALPQIGGKSYPDGFSCYAENARGHYHEIFKYCTKGSYKNGSILYDFECFRTLHDALFRRKVYQTYGCFYGIDMNEIRDTFDPGDEDSADVCFKEILARLDATEEPERVVEDLFEILRLKIPAEGKGIRYISAQSIRYAYDETPPERRAELKDKIIGYLWERLDAME